MNPKTKMEMVRKTVTNANDAIGMYLDGNVCRTWKEDFRDESNGEIVSIDRSEILVSKGKKVDADLASSLNFYLQAGDITEIKVCSQQRLGSKFNSDGLWRVVVNADLETQVYLLRAKGIETVCEIISDWMEQRTNSAFTIIKIERLYNLRVIEEVPENIFESKDPKDYYVARVRKECFEKVDDGELKKKIDLKALIFTTNAGSAEEIAMNFYDKLDEEVKDDRAVYNVRLTSKAVSQFKVTEIIPDGFCEMYSIVKENDI